MRENALYRTFLFWLVPMMVMVLLFHPIQLMSQKDTIHPSCIVNHYILQGIDQLGAKAVFPIIAVDGQSDLQVIEYFHLKNAEELLPGDQLDCGKHTVQGLFVDKAGNFTICEFDIWVKCIEDVMYNPANAESGPYPYNRDFVKSDEKLKNEMDESHFLGSLSIIWESGNKGSGTISKGKGDPGGVSYGIYQLSSRYGSLREFLRTEGESYSEELKHLTPGTSLFNSKWREIAYLDGNNFRKTQHHFVERKYYLPFKERLKETLALDIDNYSHVLKDVAWSTAVQHGPLNNIFKYALRSTNINTITEEEIIQRVYNERGRTRNGILVHFPRVSQRWQHSLIQRFKSEKTLALSRLESWKLKNTEAEPSFTTNGINVAELKENLDLPAILCVEFDHEILQLWDEHDMSIYPLITHEDPIFEPDNFMLMSMFYRDLNDQIEFPGRDISALSGRVEVTETDTGIWAQNESDISPEILDPTDDELTDIKFYRILFMVTDATPREFSNVSDVGNITTITNNKAGLTQYFIGEFNKLEDASQTLKKVFEAGYKAAVIAEFNHPDQFELVISK